MTQCPSAAHRTDGRPEYCINYSHVAGCGGGRSIGLFTYPAEVALFLDGQYSSTDRTGYYIVYCRLCYPTGHTDGIRNTNGMAWSRHNEGANVTFLDGHAKWVKSSFLQDPTQDELHRKFWWHNPPA